MATGGGVSDDGMEFWLSMVIVTSLLWKTNSLVTS